ncbi:hypothetical protein Ahy_A03g010693 [Arachis hypogaea]|uniref:CCHC-type domain-containing protein n=1 Tax=Arachis hypogaea TaxID=3818 RepID=A0A445DN76_ARAHY|nr:hypothetical protein Ahy_A03g010693 [Arachis hypogaea]
MELWVQIHGLPLSYITRKTAETIGRKIGTVMEAENPRLNDTLQRTFLRVRVTMNITKPLPTGFWLAAQEHQTLWVDFKYERIQDSYCLNCGILGHTKKECRNPMAMASWDHMKPRYVLGLGVNRARAISARGKAEDEKEMYREGTEARQEWQEERARMEHMEEHLAAARSMSRGLRSGVLRNLEVNSDQKSALGRESQGSRKHGEDVSGNLLIEQAVSDREALGRGHKSVNTNTDIKKGSDKFHEIGEVSSAFRPNATLSVEQEASGPCNSQNIHKPCQEHLEVGKSEGRQPFHNNARLNETCVNELKQIEDWFQHHQVEGVAWGSPVKLTIAEELQKFFGKKEAQPEQHSDMIINEQPEKGAQIVRHGATQLWSYREKPKMKRIVIAAGRTIIQRMDNGEKYYVELPEEHQDTEEATAAASEQKDVSQRGLELAFDVGLNLNSKRFRDASSLAVYVDSLEDGAQQGLEKSGKKLKHVAGLVMAEEASLIMPHQQP